MIAGKRILLTGGAGFIGSRLAARLVADNEVVVLDTMSRDALTATPAASKLTLVRGDVLDADLVGELADGANVIVHLASVAGVDAVLDSPVETMRTNLVGTANVLAAALATKSTLERLIDFSTSEVFGAYAYRVGEADPTSQGSVGEARWTYSVSKLAGEHLARAYHDEYGVPTVSVRPFNVYGPGQVGKGAVRSFVLAALDGEPLVVHNEGSQIRAWCFIDDMVSAVLAMIERDEAVGQVFNVGSTRSVVTIYDLARRIRTIAGVDVPIVFQKDEHVDVELRVPNVDKARELLGWEAKVELDEGLERTIAWYRGERPATVAGHVLRT